MAAPAVVVVWNSRLSGTDAKPLKNVTFSEDLSDPGVHHTPRAAPRGGARARASVLREDEEKLYKHEGAQERAHTNAVHMVGSVQASTHWSRTTGSSSATLAGKVPGPKSMTQTASVGSSTPAASDGATPRPAARSSCRTGCRATSSEA